jgi:hypothetical protein
MVVFILSIGFLSLDHCSPSFWVLGIDCTHIILASTCHFQEQQILSPAYTQTRIDTAKDRLPLPPQPATPMHPQHLLQRKVRD